MNKFIIKENLSILSDILSLDLGMIRILGLEILLKKRDAKNILGDNIGEKEKKT